MLASQHATADRRITKRLTSTAWNAESFDLVAVLTTGVEGVDGVDGVDGFLDGLKISAATFLAGVEAVARTLRTFLPEAST